MTQSQPPVKVMLFGGLFQLLVLVLAQWVQSLELELYVVVDLVILGDHLELQDFPDHETSTLGCRSGI